MGEYSETYKIDQKPPELCIPIELTSIIYHQHQGKVKDQNHDMKVYDQCLSGQSIIKLKNGNLYDGNIEQGYMHGKGKLKCFNGTVYTGDFKYNTISGSGRYDWPDSSFYEGEVMNGLRHGYGTYTSPNQEVVYQGYWDKGQRHGKGKLNFINGQLFEGSFNHGFKDGFGKMVYPNGNYYEGQWKYDKKEGYGIMNWITTNQKYSGEWKNNIQNGYGVFIFLDNKGEGKELRNRYEGQWFNGQRHGEGTFYYADSSKYEGEWKNNMKHGQGVLTEQNGEISIQEYFRDKPIKNKHNIHQDTYGYSKKSPKGLNSTGNFFQGKKMPVGNSNEKSGKKVKFKNAEEEKQAEQEKIMEILLEEERQRKLEIQMNPFTQIVDISDLTEFYNESRLKIHSELIQVLLRHNSTIKQLYKSCQQKYDNSIGEQCFCLDLRGFWQLCRETKILDSSVTLAQINRLFLQGSKNNFDVEQNQEQLQKKLKIVKQYRQKNKKLQNKDLKNIDMIEILNQVKDKNEKSIFEMNDEQFNDCEKQLTETSQMISPNSKQDNINFNNKKTLKNVHDGSRPILLRHFTDLIIRAAVIKYQDVENLGKIMEKLLFDKIFFQLEKQRLKAQSQMGSNQNNSNSNPSQIKSSSVNISYLEDNDVGGKYKKVQESLQTEIEQIFETIAIQNRSEKYGYIDKTCKIKDFYKMLINAGYIKDLSDKHIIFHVIERSYDPQSVISALDQQMKQQEKSAAHKKNKNMNIKLKKHIDKQKQLKLIVMLDSEIIFYEMSELLVHFLCRKDRDMAHTKNDELFKKKLLVHLQKLINSQKQQLVQQSQKDQKKPKAKRVWVRTIKDDQKEKLAKERVIKNKKLQEEQKEKDLKLREAKERLLMGKEDFNVPDINEEEFEDFDESEIEVYDDDYLANF